MIRYCEAHLYEYTLRNSVVQKYRSLERSLCRPGSSPKRKFSLIFQFNYICGDIYYLVNHHVGSLGTCSLSTCKENVSIRIKKMIKDLSSSFLALGNWEEIDMNMQLVRRRAGQITDGNLLAIFHFPQCTPTFPTHIRKSKIHYMGVTYIFFTQIKAPRSIVSQLLHYFFCLEKSDAGIYGWLKMQLLLIKFLGK